MELVGNLILKFGREATEQIVKLHFERYCANISTEWTAHQKEFGRAWDGIKTKIVQNFSQEEEEKYNSLATEHQKEAFIIIRAFAGCAAYKGVCDFPIARDSLADRLFVSPQGAGEIVHRLIDIGVIVQTRAYVPTSNRHTINGSTHSSLCRSHRLLRSADRFGGSSRIPFAADGKRVAIILFRQETQSSRGASRTR